MKAKTHYLKEDNHYEVYFTYEDYYGGETFRSFSKMQKDGEVPNMESKCGTLVGWLYSHYWGTLERIDIMELRRKPTRAEIRQFIRDCNNCVKGNAIELHGERLKMQRDSERFFL